MLENVVYCLVTLAPKTLKFSKSFKWLALEDGTPGEIRTPDLMVRSHALYPTELRARAGKAADSIM